MKFPCYIEFKANGRILRIVHKNQRPIAEIVVHGKMEEVATEIHGLSPSSTSPEPFEGECYGLADYEQIDENDGRVVEVNGSWHPANPEQEEKRLRR